jgi:hypothetical protein
MPMRSSWLQAVGHLIEGFETPYGLELLATVHWLAKHQQVEDPAAARHGVANWNRRKARLMKTHQVDKAWERLASQHWIGSDATGCRAASHGPHLG